MTVKAATTSLGEARRQGQVKEQTAAQSHDELNWFTGRIKRVNETRRLIIVSRADEGTSFGGDENWVTLAHSVREIVERFGTIRKGMEVLVFYQGKPGAKNKAFAFVIGEEDETGPSKDLHENDMRLGFSTILTASL